MSDPLGVAETPRERRLTHRFSLSGDADRWYCTHMASLRLKAVYDDEARVWTVSDDTLGLVAEADTVELLEYKLQELIPELVELNAIDLPRLTARRA